MTKQQRLVLLIAILASFVTFLDGSVVNVALPAIRHDLGGGLTLQQWVVDAYLIAQGSLMLVAGSVSDLFGRKKVLLFGLLGFLVTSLACALAPNGGILIGARGLQGVAAALLVPSSLALIISAFSGTAQGKAIGTWTAWTGIAFVVGPLLGGALVDAGSWRWIFAINVIPISITLVLLRGLDVPERLIKGVNIDIGGALLGALALAGSGYALIEQSNYGWASPLIFIPLTFGVLSLAAFLWREKTARQPMLPLGLFTVRNFWVGNLATVAIYSGLSVATFLIVIFLQEVAGYSAIDAGFALLPVTIIMFFLSSRIGALAGRFGPRWFMAGGPLLAASGFFLMLRVSHHVNYWSQFLPAILLFGLGLATTVAPLTSAILGAIASKQAGIASAVNNAVSRIAGLVAVAAIGLVIGPKLDLSSFHRGVAVVGFLLVIGGIISALGIRTIENQTK